MDDQTSAPLSRSTNNCISCWREDRQNCCSMWLGLFSMSSITFTQFDNTTKHLVQIHKLPSYSPTIYHDFCYQELLLCLRLHLHVWYSFHTDGVSQAQDFVLRDACCELKLQAQDEPKSPSMHHWQRKWTQCLPKPLKMRFRQVTGLHSTRKKQHFLHTAQFCERCTIISI